MKDETYTLVQTNRERKAMANGARHRVIGSRSRKVTLPSDNLTAKQRKELNSAVSTYTMNEPHTIKQLRTWPTDVRREYMARIIDTFKPENRDLALMLGVGHATTASKFVAELGLSNRKLANVDDKVAFQSWLRGEVKPDALNDTPAAPASMEPETEAAPAPAEPEVRLAPMSYDSISVSFTGSVQDLLRAIVNGPLSLPATDTYSFTICAVRKEAV